MNLILFMALLMLLFLLGLFVTLEHKQKRNRKYNSTTKVYSSFFS